MFAFQLWREFKLSIAEILAVFPDIKIINFSKEILIADNILKKEILEKINFLGWTQKVIEIPYSTISFGVDSVDKNFEEIILEKAKEKEGKFNYWLNIFSDKKNVDLKKNLSKIKKFLRENDINSRFINNDFKNLNSAQIIWEKLVKKETDFNIIELENNNYFWKTIWIQDINSYSKRDYDKERDMQIWMLPPKLAQIMINLASNFPIPPKIGGKQNFYPSPILGVYRGNIIYDPFVWLGTVLLEAKLMWFKKLFWSDLNEKMVETASKNLNPPAFKIPLIKENKNYIVKIEKLNAKFINEANFWNEVKDWTIVTEWYLWEVMTQSNINLDRIQKQKEALLKIYKPFFENLKKWKFSWIIVISFPFWEIKWKFVYFEEIYEVLKEYSEIINFFPESLDLKTSKSWSLFYKRDKQLVWREIFKLKIKK